MLRGSHESAALLNLASPSRRDRALALSIAVLASLALVLAAPFARVQLPVINAFIPAYQSALLITDLVTSVLLYNLFVRARSTPLLVLASAYLFDALMIVPHTLTFPGVFTDRGLLGAGVQTTAWLYYFWHGGFIAFLLGYIVLSSRPVYSVRKSGPAVLASVLVVTAIVAAITALTTKGQDWLPVTVQAGVRADYSLQRWITPLTCAMALVGVGGLWPRRKHSLLDLWLLVVLFSWTCGELINGVLGGQRFDLGWYGGRMFGLVASGFLLVMLLISVYQQLDEKIRDLEQSTHQRRRSEAYLAEAQRLTLTGSWAWDPRRNELVHCSEEVYRLYGLDPRNGVPTVETLVERILPEDRERVSKTLMEAVRQKTGRVLDFRISLPDGTLKYIESIRRPVVGMDGNIVEVVGTSMDVTQRRRAQEQAQRLRQLEDELAHLNRLSIMGELTASLAHEILHPIATSRNNARLCIRYLEQSPPNLAEIKEGLASVVKDADRAKDIVARIRDQIKKAPSQQQAFDLNEAIQEVLVMVRSAIDKGGVSVETRFMNQLDPVRGDRVQVQQVVLNLIVNAVEAMTSQEQQRRELSISTKLSGTNGILVEVRDSGPGIHPDQLERIFNAFYTTKAAGLGMGLSICRSIINAHGGRLWAEANDDRGATFRFTLPQPNSADEKRFRRII